MNACSSHSKHDPMCMECLRAELQYLTLREVEWYRVNGLWIVGQVKSHGWEFQGVFLSKERAIAACRTDQYFIGPATINESLPHERRVWEGAYYPLAQQEGGTE